MPAPDTRTKLLKTGRSHCMEARLSTMRPFPRMSTAIWYATPNPRPMVVASAAPSRPRRGIGPNPKIKSGSSAMLIRLAIHSARMAMVASPAPRRMALFRKSKKIVVDPAKSIAV